MIEVLDHDEKIIFDITNPYNWSLDDEDIANAYESVQKILILVEGVNDKKVIDDFFKILYPDFVHLYEVVSFEGSVQGGSSLTRHYFNIFVNCRFKLEMQQDFIS